MDYPREELNKELLWREFILSKALLVFGILITLVSFILLVAGISSSDWQVVKASTGLQFYEMKLGLLSYQVIQSSYSTIIDGKNLGTFSYNVVSNVSDLLAKESYKRAGIGIFTTLFFPLVSYIISFLSGIYAIVGYGPRPLVALMAYLSWGLSALAGASTLLLATIWSLVKNAPDGLSIPTDIQATTWIENVKPMEPVGASWAVTLSSGIIPTVIQPLIIVFPLLAIFIQRNRSRT